MRPTPQQVASAYREAFGKEFDSLGPTNADRVWKFIGLLERTNDMKTFKVGQIWATRNDSRAEIVAIDLHEGAAVYRPIGAVVRSPDATTLETYSVHGVYYEEQPGDCGLDLVSLVKEVP